MNGDAPSGENCCVAISAVGGDVTGGGAATPGENPVTGDRDISVGICFEITRIARIYGSVRDRGMSCESMDSTASGIG